MGTFNWPDFSGFLVQCWGSPSFESDPNYQTLYAAANITVGPNPPYYLTDFFGFFPQWAGAQQIANGTLTSGSPIVTFDNSLNTQGFVTGQFIANYSIPSVAIPSGTTILSRSVGTSAIGTAVAHGGNSGSGYVVGDILTVVQSGASGGQLKVTSIGAGGAVTGVQALNNGTGYAAGTALATTGGSGTGAAVDITAVVASATLSQNALLSGTFPLTLYVGPPPVPYAVINAYLA